MSAGGGKNYGGLYEYAQKMRGRKNVRREPEERRRRRRRRAMRIEEVQTERAQPTAATTLVATLKAR